MAVNQFSPILESRNHVSVHVDIDIFSLNDCFKYTYIYIYLCIYIFILILRSQNEGQMYLESPGFKYPVAMRITSISVQIPRPPKLKSFPTPSCQLPR